jgi:sulfofructose kinase
VDYLVCSESFAARLTGIKEAQQALQELSRCNRNIVITLGKNGLIYKTMKTNGHLPAYKIEATDTTGAGDVFHGAFAACLALKKGWDDTLEFSSAAAALSCTKQGARTSIPSKKEVEVFLKAYTQNE